MEASTVEWVKHPELIEIITPLGAMDVEVAVMSEGSLLALGHHPGKIIIRPQDEAAVRRQQITAFFDDVECGNDTLYGSQVGYIVRLLGLKFQALALPLARSPGRVSQIVNSNEKIDDPHKRRALIEFFRNELDVKPVALRKHANKLITDIYSDFYGHLFPQSPVKPAKTTLSMKVRTQDNPYFSVTSNRAQEAA